MELNIEQEIPQLAGLSEEAQKIALERFIETQGDNGDDDDDAQEITFVDDTDGDDGDEGDEPDASAEIDEPETQEEPEKKVVDLRALQEERAKRQALQNEIAQLKAQLQQQQQPVQEQQKQDSEIDYDDVVETETRRRFKQKFGREFDDEVANARDIAAFSRLSNQTSNDLDNHLKQQAELQAQQQRELQQRKTLNDRVVSFWNEQSAAEDFTQKQQAFQARFVSLPQDEQLEIQDAIGRLDAGKGTPADFRLLREEWNKTTSIAPKIQVQQNNNNQNKMRKVNDIAALPRTPKGSNGAGNSWSITDIQAALKRGGDGIPKEILEQVRKGYIE